MSKYQEVVEDIIRKIENNEYTDKLPTEDQLIEQYQVSRNTIRNASRTLKKQGTLFSIQGSGVFVRHTRDDDSLWMNGSCGITENAPRHKITTDVKGFHIMMAGEELSKRMQCELTTPIYYIERIRKMDGVPMAIEYTYYNKDLIPCCTGMIQREVAQRIAAEPGNKTYGILSILIQAWYNVEYLFTVDENVFNPPPKVKSAVIRMTRNSTTDLGCDWQLFRRLVKTVFNQRRKMLRVSLKQMFSAERQPSDGFCQQDIMTKRPEQLSIPQFVELTNMVAKELE